MTKKWIAINLMLLLCAGLLGWQLKVAVERFKVENDPAKIQPVRKKSETDGALPQVQPPRRYNEAEFAAVPANNVFMESRKPDDKPDVSPQPEIKVLQSKPVLVGTVVSGSRRLAMILDPTPVAGSSSRTRTMRIGDVYQGFVLTEITDSSIVLESGASKEIIDLHDTSKPAQTGKTVVGLARVVNFGGASQGGTLTAASVTAGGSRPAGTPVATPAPAVGGRANIPGAPIQSGAGRGGGAAQNPVYQQAPVQGTQGLFPNQYIDARGNVVTTTPFGILPQPGQQQPPVKK